METALHTPPPPAGGGIARRLADFRRWRDELGQAIGEYQAWLERQGFASGEDDLKVYELIDSLRSDKLTVALVAEFSRGKTELINAIFFADYQQRLLPSEAGRTTMCPTELLYDEKLPPCIRLLPIETRKTSLTISEYKRTEVGWTTLPLALDSPEQMAEAFQETVKTRPAPVREAIELGLYPQPAEGAVPPVAEVEIPVWRHAVINYPHPLLKQGLVILDTPGLNSLGIEPELTLSMLPKAQAVLFVLAADTGVTKSDLEAWNHYVRLARHDREGGCLAVLNKIDTLWDDLRGEEDVTRNIRQQAEETARILGIGPNRVFPVSAQKGLVGKIKHDPGLLARSRLPELEGKLSSDIISSKQELLRNKVTQELSALIETTNALVASRLAATDGQIQELRQLGERGLDVIEGMLARVRHERQIYNRRVEDFQSTRAVLAEQCRELLERLSVEAFDRLIAKTRTEMHDSWTTHGLRIGMTALFAGATEAMEQANRQAQQIKALLEATYDRFHREHGLPKMKPVNFSLLPYRAELARLRDEAEAFRSSLRMVMTEQHFVIRSFFITLVSRARMVVGECNAGARAWGKSVMAPVLAQIRENKTMLERRVETLKRIQSDVGGMGRQLAELQAARQELLKQQQLTRAMIEKINRPLPAA
jgi:hypothetical protein